MQPRTVMGILFLLSGLVFFGAGGAVMVQTLDTNASSAERTRRAEISCREQIVKLGRVLPRENDEIEIEITGEGDAGLADPRKTLSDATAALAMCTGREIVAACLGTTCGTETPGPVKMLIRMGLAK